MKCTNGKKVAYRSEDQAKEARKSVAWNHRKEAKNMRVYKCPYCQKYHLTSSKY